MRTWLGAGVENVHEEQSSQTLPGSRPQRLWHTYTSKTKRTLTLTNLMLMK